MKVMNWLKNLNVRCVISIIIAMFLTSDPKIVLDFLVTWMIVFVACNGLEIVIRLLYDRCKNDS